MTTFVSLMNWTDQGVRQSKDTVERSKAATGLAAQMGGEIKAIYWTIGPYDLVAVAEFPDEQTATAFQLALAASGNLRTTTMRAFSADEMTTVLGKLG